MRKKNVIALHIEKNALVDAGDGIVEFPNGFTITDDSKMRSGIKYDINTGDLTKFNGTVTADHAGTVQSIVAEVMGLTREANRVYIQGLRFALKNAYGRLCYDLMVDGFLKDASTETIGDWPGQDDTFHNWELTGLSLIPYGNNRSASLMNAVHNSIEQAKQDGLDTTEVERILEELEPEPASAHQAPAPEPPAPQPAAAPANQAASTVTKQDEQPMFKTIKNSRDFAIKITYKNAAGDEVSPELAPGATVDVSEDQAEAVEKQLNEAQAPEPDFKADIAEAVNAAVAPLTEKVAELEKKQFNSQASAPAVQKGQPGEVPAGPAVTKNKFEEMDWRERVGFQINASITKDFASMQKLHEMNQYHLEKLKEAKVVNAAITLDSFSGFVLPPEMITEIQGVHSNYQPLLAAFPFQETLRTKMTWLERDGDMIMKRTMAAELAAAQEDTQRRRRPDAAEQPAHAGGAGPCR